MLVRSNDLFPMLFNNVFNSINDAWNQNFPRDPQINISESKLNYKIEFCVPGLTKEDLNLTIDTDNNLVISMEHKRPEPTAAENAENAEGVKVEKPKDKEEYHFLRHDFHMPHFKEAIALPDNIHKDKITAKVENGILRIFLPKVTPEEQAKLAQTINIE